MNLHDNLHGSPALEPISCSKDSRGAAFQTEASIARQAARNSPKLATLLALSPCVESRYALNLRNLQTGDNEYDERKVYVYEDADPRLVTKAIELIDRGCTHVMLNRKSVTGRLRTRFTEAGFRTRRSYIKFTLEMKERP